MGATLFTPQQKSDPAVRRTSKPPQRKSDPPLPVEARTKVEARQLVRADADAEKGEAPEAEVTTQIETGRRRPLVFAAGAGALAAAAVVALLFARGGHARAAPPELASVAVPAPPVHADGNPEAAASGVVTAAPRAPVASQGPAASQAAVPGRTIQSSTTPPGRLRSIASQASRAKISTIGFAGKHTLFRRLYPVRSSFRHTFPAGRASAVSGVRTTASEADEHSARDHAWKVGRQAGSVKRGKESRPAW